MTTLSAGATRFALRANNRIAYDPGSPRDQGSPAIPFLLLHDLLADRSVFHELTGRLRSSARVIVPDIRGHGASATLANQRVSIAELALDILAILDAESEVAAHICGHGLGGVIALEMAIRAPARVHSLTLIEPALLNVLDSDPNPRVLHLREDRRASDRSSADAAYKGLTDKSIELYLAARNGPEWRDELARPRLAAIRRHAGALTGLLPALEGYVVPTDGLSRLAKPITLVQGTTASEIDRAVVARLLLMLPASHLQEIQLGHRAAAPFAGPATEELASMLLSAAG